MSSAFQFVDHSDHQARSPPLLSDDKVNRRRCSKAQACLHKILHIIASSKNPSFSLQSSNRGMGIDLNLRLCSASFGDKEEEEEEEEKVGFGNESGSFSSSSVAAREVGERNTVLEKSSEVECEPAKQTDEMNCERVVEAGERDHDKAEEEEEEEEEEEDDDGDEDGVSEITNVQVQSFEKSDEDRASEMKRSNSDGFLGLLVEAAKLISGHGVGNGDEDKDGETESRGRPSQRREHHVSPRTKVDPTEEPTKTELVGPKKKRKISGAGESEVDAPAPPPQPTSLPVVRSKRGRNQVLPYRFRDSVLEPWARLSRSNPVPSKRKVGVKP